MLIITFGDYIYREGLFSPESIFVLVSCTCKNNKDVQKFLIQKQALHNPEVFLLTLAGIQNSTLISENRLYLCESGDEIRSLNDRCNQRKDCNDESDERDCAQCRFSVTKMA